MRLLRVVGPALALLAAAGSRAAADAPPGEAALHARAKAQPGGRLTETIQTDGGVVFPTLPELIKRSSVVVIGRPLRGRAHLTPDGASVTTRYTIHVQEVLKGSVRNGSHIFVLVPGGAHRFGDGRRVVVKASDLRRMDPKRGYVFFLRDAGAAPRQYLPTGGAQGLFQLRDGRVIQMSRLREHPIGQRYTTKSMKLFLDDVRAAVGR
jgi:hypothetical protein